MTDPDLIRFIRQEIRREMNIILSGESGTNDAVDSEDIQNMYPGMPTITQRPVVHPYGFASRAPKGTIQVVARQGEHIGNRVVLGHRAKDRPKSLAEGETAVYNVGGYIIRLGKTKVEIGKGEVFETMVVGDQLSTLLGGLLDAIASHVHGPPGSPPVNAAAFTALKTNNVDNGKILAKDGGRF